MELSNKDIFKAIHRSQHTQRCWDLSKEIPQEDLDILLEAVTQCPSKQNRAFYRAYFITDRGMIESLHDTTKGFGYSPDPDNPGQMKSVTNSQTLANLLVAFEAYVPEQESRESPYRPPTQDSATRSFLAMRDQHQAVGVAAGYLNVIATLMGYETGCCACFDIDSVKEILDLDSEPLLLMGIGFKDNSRNRRVHHTDDDFVFPTLRKTAVPVIWHKQKS